MKRGEVWWVRFGPSVGSEIQKTRPALIISNDSSNAALNRLQVVPITSNTSRIYPSEALIELNGEPRKAAADQMSTVSKERITDRLGTIAEDDMALVEQAIKTQLGLS